MSMHYSVRLEFILSIILSLTPVIMSVTKTIFIYPEIDYFKISHFSYIHLVKNKQLVNKINEILSISNREKKNNVSFRIC